MISQSSTAFPPRFDFSSLANQKKLVPPSRATASTQPQQPQPHHHTTTTTITAATTGPVRKPMTLAPIPQHDSDEEETSAASTTQRREPGAAAVPTKKAASGYGSDSDDSYYSSSVASSLVRKVTNERSNSHGTSSSSSSSSSSSNTRNTRNSAVAAGVGAKKHHSGSDKKVSGDRRRRDSEHSDVSRRFRDRHDVQMENLRDRPMTEEEYRMKQIDLIMALRQMRDDGIPVDETVELNQSTPLQKLQFAHDYAHRYVIRRATFESFQQYLTLGTQFVEMGNSLVRQKTGVGAELEGWGASVMLNMPRFNRPLQRLAQKYSGKTESSPEVELAMLLGYSAMSFHFAKKYSLDPQLAMQFADFLSTQDRANASSSPSPSSHPPLSPMGTPTIARHAAATGMRPTASPLGMRPPAPQPSRPPRSSSRDDDDSVSDTSSEMSSSETEEVMV
jgi:hypothetical protein